MAFPLINVRFILLISASFIAIFSSIAIYFCLPLLISHVIRTQITLSPTSGSYNGWRLNSVIDQMYLYNITNLVDLTESTSTASRRQVPKFQQVGPFTFRQDREKINIKFDPSNETVLYDQKRQWTFLPELSVAKSVEEMSSLWINHISVPLAGTTLNAEYSDFIDPIVREFDLRLFLNHSVNTLLFEGYHDILMEQAKASGQVDVDRFGWMHNQNNTISKAIRVFTGPSNATLEKFGSVDQMNYKRQFNIWHNNNTEPHDFSNVACNEFRFSSAGEFFPPPEHSLISHNYYFNHGPHQHQPRVAGQNELATTLPLVAQSLNSGAQASKTIKPIIETESRPEETKSALFKGSLGQAMERHEKKVGKSISLFMPDLCRTIPLVYNGSYYYRELLVDRYIANEFTYVYPPSEGPTAPPSGDSSDKFSNKLVESNKCYCIYNESSKTTSCPPNGIMDLFTCRKGSPISVSFPHFLYSTRDKSLEPTLKMFSDDVQANLLEHEFFVDLEASLNVPVNVQVVYQFNVHLRNEQSMNFTKEYAYLFDDPASDIGSSSSSSVRDLYLPQMWIKSTAQIDDQNLKSLLFIQKHLSLVTPITTIIIFGFASILLMAAAKLAYDLTYGPNTSRKTSIACDHESCSSLNGDRQCSYLEAQKKTKKYFDVSLLAGEKAAFHHQLGASSTTSCNGGAISGPSQKGDVELGASHRALPSTSKKTFVMIKSSSLADFNESQPLNG